MKQRFFDWDIWVLLASFLISRIILSFFKVEMDYSAIATYWQYLSLDSLENNLLNGIWYNHTQPPVFNLFLGGITKLFGTEAASVFPYVFRLITIINVTLLCKSLQLLVTHPKIPLFVSLLYLLSPATMILENELFYTTFMTMLVLVSSYSLIRFDKERSYLFAFGFMLPLAVACLTRSMYNLSWLIVIAVVSTIYYKKLSLRMLTIASVMCVLLAGSWYLKNYFIFGKFTTSTWLGMNLARNVFHDHTFPDTTKIESIEPFSKISSYQRFISGNLENKYAGLNDHELLSEFKNGSHVNENHINYIEVSEKYADASKAYIKSNPWSFVKNAMQSSVIFFAPATRYPFAEPQSKKIQFYDVAYSFNLTHFAKNKGERRVALVVSALPKIILYVLTFGFVILGLKRTGRISAVNLFIILTFLYIFSVSTLMEHYENMRFRFEIEPLYLLLLGQVLDKKWRTIKSLREKKFYMPTKPSVIP